MITGVCERPQLAAQREPVLARQHEVEHDEIDVRSLEHPPHRLALADGGHAIAILLEVVAQQCADVAVVIDDQNVLRGGVHGIGKRHVCCRAATIRPLTARGCNQMLLPPALQCADTTDLRGEICVLSA